MKKIELLAPAGNFEALRGAVNAGADAVYLGGGQYGARAYAENFPQEKLLEGLRLSHIFGKKIYLTVNTLVKEKELDGLYNFLMPLYEGGLDGVIVQDLGVLRYIKKCFPSLAIHASTQMTLTGSYGANLIKREGVSRIVPARELSLEEIKKLKEETNLEIEAFIHGAMCYCYSGQCLLSSILGGRSGNRGRCAQPCRLPYQTNDGTEAYPLSMRDMCTLQLLPELIDAGIDSFKIEGRMKKPAYAAGVTAIYRKYIDLYEKDKENYRVDVYDMERLKSLYIRSEISSGYYHRQNGREMISLFSPAYSAADEKLLSAIEKEYVHKKPCHVAEAKIVLKAGEPAKLTLQTGEHSISCQGDFAQEAKKQPLSRDKVKEQIQKSGNSLIKIETVDVILQGTVFMPVGAINELRRKTVAAMEEEIIRGNGLRYEKRMSAEKLVHTVIFSGLNQSVSFEKHHTKQRFLHASVRTYGQLEAALEAQKSGTLSRIYVEYDLLNEETNSKLSACLQEHLGKDKEDQTEIYAATPYIVRKKDICKLKKLVEAFSEMKINGILIRNLESYGFLAEQIPSRKLVVDAGLYIWNRETLHFWEGKAAEFYFPLECRAQELQELLRSCPQRKIKASSVIYGRLPMMVTANCLKKTMGKCNSMPEIVTLTDRYGKQFPVYTDCGCCYNIIYNSVPLSLHKMFANGFWENSRLDFTVESRDDTLKVIRYFQGLLSGFREPFYKEYTTGHYKRGVE